MKDKPYVYNLLVDLVRSVVPRGKVVDAGCGSGAFSRAFHEAGYDVVPLDLDPEGFQVQGLSPITADLTRAMPLPDSSADAVVSGEVLEHLENHHAFIRECRRVVRPGGVVAFTTPNLLNLGSRLAFLFTGLRTFRSIPPVESQAADGHLHINFVSYYQLRFMLHRNGFRILRLCTTVHSKTAIAFAPLAPLVSYLTRRAFSRVRVRRGFQGSASVDPALLREIHREVLSRPLLFGKKLVVLAERLN